MHDAPNTRAAMPGRLVSIWVKRSHRGPMDAFGRAVLTPGRGIDGNADRGGRRQVTMIDAARWQSLMAELRRRHATPAAPAFSPAEPPERRANLLLEGIDLANSRGRILRVGRSVRLKVNGETRPCERMDEVLPGLQEAMRTAWGGGAYAEVVDGGEIALADPVAWEA
jgi:MOSC domain-containing protein YiiM